MENIHHEKWMKRCLQLASNGKGLVSPNPLVGCVIVYKNKIIGEGYHHKYGEDHAEVVAIKQVKDQSLLVKSTLYVNLEPCAHFGKTPPCCNLIALKKIKKVVIGAVDSNKLVGGKGIEYLKNSGVNITTNILAEECILLNKHFYSVHSNKRPYIYLKHAESADGKIGKLEGKSTPISNNFSNQVTHQLRNDVDAILVGKTTFLNDKPSLTTRNIIGSNCKKFILTNGGDMQWAKNLDLSNWTIITFGKISDEYDFIKLNNNNWKQILSDELISRGINAILIEGGKATLDYFISENFFDEYWKITSSKNIYKGIDAPQINNLKLIETKSLDLDLLQIFHPSNQPS